MDVFNGEHQEVISPEAFTFLLLKRTSEFVKGTTQILEKHLSPQYHSNLTKVESESFFFFVFALDYHWTKLFAISQEEINIFREAFNAHLENVVSLDNLQERLTAYAQIAVEKEGSPVMFLDFGRKFSEFCGISGLNALLMLAPDLFKTALELLTTTKSVRLKLR